MESAGASLGAVQGRAQDQFLIDNSSAVAEAGDKLGLIGVAPAGEPIVLYPEGLGVREVVTRLPGSGMRVGWMQVWGTRLWAITSMCMPITKGLVCLQ